MMVQSRGLFLRLIFLFLCLVLLLNFACAMKISPAQSPSTKLTVKTSGITETEMSSWRQEWDKILAIAKKEGKVVVYSSTGGQAPDILRKAFKEKYGIEAEIISGRAGLLNERTLRERKAGLYLVDVDIGGLGTDLFYQLKPANALDSLEPILILPEVKDDKYWWQGLGWTDDERTALRFLAYISPSIAINMEFVKENQIKRIEDLLDPAWRGKIVMMDPTSGGSGMRFIGFLLEIKGRPYIEALAKQQPVFTTDERLQVEWIAKGKYWIALSPDGTLIDQFAEIGVPLRYAPVEVQQLTAGGGSVGVFNNRPHPYAATVFVNWLLSQEGQLVFSKAKGAQSRRIDIPVDHLNPAAVRKAGVKYFDQNRREFLLAGEGHKKIAKEIFGPLMK